MIEGYDVEVRLLAVTGLSVPTEHLGKGAKGPPCEQIIEYAGRLCWNSVDKMGTNPQRIQSWIQIGHESVIEHASASFFIRASRVLTHELVRHRLASYSQRSQRYVKELEPRYITPPEVADSGKENGRLFEEAMKQAWNVYRQMLDSGIKPEIARYVLPNACETQIVMTMNFRELRRFIRLRTSERALPEMRAVAGEIRRILKEIAPSVFEDL